MNFQPLGFNQPPFNAQSPRQFNFNPYNPNQRNPQFMIPNGRPLSQSVTPTNKDEVNWEEETIHSVVSHVNREKEIAKNLPKTENVPFTSTIDQISRQIRDAFIENDELFSKNKKLKQEFGVFDKNFLKNMESMMKQKEALQLKVSESRAFIPDEVQDKIFSYYVKENQRLEDVIKSYERECEFLKSRISRCHLKTSQSNNSSFVFNRSIDLSPSKSLVPNIEELQRGMQELQNENEKLKRLLREKGTFV